MLTTGTFLRGLIHIGERQTPAGRVGEAPALGLSLTLERLGFALGRLKTGTPPRLDGRTIDWAAVEMQPGDEPPEPFSTLTERISQRQVQCGITRTTEATHRIIRDNVHRSPMYSGPDREPRAALLPVDRGQDRALRRARRASDLPGAGGARRPDRLPERHLDLAAGRGPAGVGRDHSGARKGAHGPARLCHRIRPRRSARARADAGGQAHAGAVPGRADQRHHRLRGSGGAGAGRGPQRAHARAGQGRREPASPSIVPRAISRS